MIKPSWKELSRIFSFILLFSVLAYNLYHGAEIWTSLYRAAVVYLIYGIISIIASNIIAKVFHSYEKKQLIEQLAKSKTEKRSGRDTGGELEDSA